MKQGFTLVEVSIVLAIIGLIVGGLLVGRDMIRSSELRSVIQDVDQAKYAYLAFQEKYNAIPGDFNRATFFWPGLTDNGGNNNRINTSNESVDAWQHLDLAGIYPGNFNGIRGAGTPADHYYKPGINLAGLKGFHDVAIRFSNPDTVTSPIYRQNVVQLARPRPSDGETVLGFLSPADGQTLDQKMDDGRASTGLFLGGSGEGATCTDGTDYLVSSTDSTVCLFSYVLDTTRY